MATETQKVGEVKTPDPYAKFKEADSTKWSNATKREYSLMAHDAYSDAAAKASPRTVCDNSGGSVFSECKCSHCLGSRAVFELQKSVAGYDPTEDKKSKGY